MESGTVIYAISPLGNYVGYLKEKSNVIGQAKSLDELKVSIYKSYLALEKFNAISKTITINAPAPASKVAAEPSFGYVRNLKQWVEKNFKTQTTLLQIA